MENTHSQNLQVYIYDVLSKEIPLPSELMDNLIKQVAKKVMVLRKKLLYHRLTKEEIDAAIACYLLCFFYVELYDTLVNILYDSFKEEIDEYTSEERNAFYFIVVTIILFQSAVRHNIKFFEPYANYIRGIGMRYKVDIKQPLEISFRVFDIIKKNRISEREMDSLRSILRRIIQYSEEAEKEIQEKKNKETSGQK